MNIKQKNTFSIVTNISVVLHNHGDNKLHISQNISATAFFCCVHHIITYSYITYHIYSYMHIHLYIYIYIYANLPVNVVVKLSHPQSGDSQGQKTFLAPSANKQTHNYDTECSNHHLPYQS